MFSQILNALKNNGDDIAASTQSFYAVYELNPENFHIEVEGVGKIGFPLNQTIIQKLQDMSSEAKYGLREKTLLDKSVRHTQEISGEKLTVNYDKQPFSNMLENMRHSLGLSENARLTAHLHNMLIYGPGQFFKEHQDSEKVEGMIASLVIVLPFAHIGGDLVISHNNKTFRFATENIDSKKLQCLAFYADCRHEVEKVRHGYRLALTYNLVLESPENLMDVQENKPLEKALEAYFADMDITAGTQKLIYFLDHSYTEHSLKWNMLKGIDRQRALNFRSAANKLGLIPHLALVEIHELWSADGDEDDPDPSELIDDSTTLSYWLDANDHKLPYDTYSISNNDACWTKDTDGFDPFNTEYEGYMGNYGNTVDYWYRRAAVVLWPISAQTAMMFKLNYESAFKDLMALTECQGNEKNVLGIIKKAGKSLYGYGRSFYTIKATEFKSFAKIGAYIQDREIAKSVLENFSLGIFEGDGTEEFVNLQNLYGVPWCLELIELWKSQKSGNSHAIKKDFDQVIVKLLSAGVDRKIALYLLDNQINQTIEDDKGSLRQTPVDLKKSITNRIHTLKNLINACDFLNDGQETQKLVDHIISNTVLYPEYDLGNMIVEEKALMEKNPLSVCFLLRDHVARGMKQELDEGVRDPDDWSIHARLGCSCDLCKTASAFLKSKADSTKIWPLVAEKRGHIMNVFDRLGLPVSFSVEKKGSPHRLVMVKSDKLHEASKERFDKLSKNYEKLIAIQRLDVS